jgi:hypothetical protein
MDLLPYPKGPKGMWYEMRTGTTECQDDVELEKAGPAHGAEEDDFAGIGDMEADEPVRKTRFNVRRFFTVGTNADRAVYVENRFAYNAAPASEQTAP